MEGRRKIGASKMKSGVDQALERGRNTQQILGVFSTIVWFKMLGFWTVTLVVPSGA